MGDDAELRIRSATPADVGAVQLVEKGAAVRFAAAGVAHLAGAGPLPTAALLRCLTHGALLVAETPHQVVGFIACNVLDGVAHVVELDVLPSHANRRLGARLLDAAEQWARSRGLPQLTLATDRLVPWNAPYYARLGFREQVVDALGPGHRQLWDVQERAGTDMSRRVVMSRPVAPAEPGSEERPWDASEFHSRSAALVYRGALGPALFKQHEHMAHVRYEAVHENAREQGDLRGHGRADVRWIFSEEPGAREGLFGSALELVHDTRVAPGAALGLHAHHRTDEVYYLLEGELTVRVRTQDGAETERTLRPGDAHAVLKGQSHAAKAGPHGARMIIICVRA